MRLCVITDEISPDLDTALRECEAMGISTVELRSVGGRNLVHHLVGAGTIRIFSGLRTANGQPVPTAAVRTPRAPSSWPPR